MSNIMSKFVGEFKILLKNIKEPTARAELLRELTVNFAALVQSSADLNQIFFGLSREERNVFFNQFKKHITPLVSTLTDLNCVGYLLSEEQVSELYLHLKNTHPFKVVTVNDFEILLKRIKEPTARAEILRELTVNFAALVQSSADLNQIFFGLSREERNVVFNQFKKHIIPLVSTLTDLNCVGYLLSEEQLSELYLHLKNTHPFKIVTVNDFEILLKRIKEPTARAEILRELTVNFAALVQSSADLNQIFFGLSREERNVVFNQFKKHIIPLVSTLTDLNCVGYLLSEEQLSELYLHLKNTHPFKIVTVNDFEILLKRIKEPTARAEILRELTVNFAALVQSSADLSQIFFGLSREERNVVFNQFKKHIIPLVSTLTDLNCVGYLLSEEQRSEFYSISQKGANSTFNQPSVIHESIRPPVASRTITSSSVPSNRISTEPNFDVNSAQTEETPSVTHESIRPPVASRTITSPGVSSNRISTEPNLDVNSAQTEETPSSSTANISMMVLGGFIAAMGVAAVAIAFTLLNAATFGIPGLVVAGIGVAAVLSGIGLFASGVYKNRPTIAENSFDYPRNPVHQGFAV